MSSLDPEQKDQLIEVIEKLLADKTTVSVISSLISSITPTGHDIPDHWQGNWIAIFISSQHLRVEYIRHHLTF